MDTAKLTTAFYENKITMDIQIPYEPAVAIVAKYVAPSNVAVGSAGAGLVLPACQDVMGDSGNPEWASRTIAPNTLLIPQGLPKQLGGGNWYKAFGSGKAADNVAPVLIKGPDHGTVKPMSNGTPKGILWQFYPNPGYTGKDQAVFRIDTPKGAYHIVMNLWVTNAYDEYATTPACKKIFIAG